MQRCVCADIFGVAFLGFAPCQALRFYVIKKKKKGANPTNKFAPAPLSPPHPQDWGSEKLELVRGMWVGGFGCPHPSPCCRAHVSKAANGWLVQV